MSLLILALLSTVRSNLDIPCSFNALPHLKRSYNPVFTVPGQYPESFDFDIANNRFIAGSANGGGLYSLSRFGGPTKLISSLPSIMGQGFMTLGIDIDNTNKQLWVCVNSPSEASVALFTLEAHPKLIDMQLMGPANSSLCNDIQHMEDGRFAYATDSYRDAIWKFDLKTPGNMSLFSDAAIFKRTGGPYGLDGIASVSEEQLLITNIQDGILYSMMLSTKQVTKVKLPAPVYGDGMISISSHSVVIADTMGHIVTLVSSDGWKTSVVMKNNTLSREIGDLSAVLKNSDEIYALHSHLGDAVLSTFRKAFEVVLA